MTEHRHAKVERETGETNVSLSLNIDGTGESSIDTPIGFLNHMLHQIARHGLIDLKIKVEGDVETGSHHTVEDTAISLGRALDSALGERKGIVRMADISCPLDEALTHVVVDLSGRGYAVVDMGISGNAGEFPPDLARHFFEAMAIEGRFCIHVRVLSGLNEHHVIESAFKAFARAFRTAASRDIRIGDTVPSTKGKLR